MLVELSQIQLDKVKSLIHKELSYLEDNKHRYEMALKGSPNNKNLKTGNDIPFTEVIKSHKIDIWFLERIIRSLEK
jgi:hypothetical protein